MAKTKAVENLAGNNLIIVLALVSLLVLGVSGLVVKTLIASIARDTKVVAAKDKADKQLKADLLAAPKLVEAYAALGSEADVINDALPNRVDFPSLIVTLESIASDGGVRLKTVAPAQAVVDEDAVGGAADASQAPDPQTYMFTVSVDGNFDAIKRFLKDLEVSARPMRVVSMQLNGSGGALSADMSIQTYYQDKAVLPFSKETIK